MIISADRVEFRQLSRKKFCKRVFDARKSLDVCRLRARPMEFRMNHRTFPRHGRNIKFRFPTASIRTRPRAKGADVLVFVGRGSLFARGGWRRKKPRQTRLVEFQASPETAFTIASHTREQKMGAEPD
jgi:hypothetical protein